MVTAVLSSATVARAKKRDEKSSPPPSRLRELRIRAGFTQAELAERAGLHRNSIKNIEHGATREVTPENAEALAQALETTVDDLGVRVKSAGPPPSIRMRQLTADQRALIDELLNLPPEDFDFVRDAIELLRRNRERTAKRRGPRS